MQNLFTYAPSAGILLGTLVAILAAILVAARQQRLAGVGLPLLATARPARATAARSGTAARKASATGGGAGNGGARKTGRAGKATPTTGDDGAANGGKGKGRRARGTPTDAPSSATTSGGNAKAGKATSARARRTDRDTAPAVNPVSGTVRLGGGALREQVYAYLLDHRGKDCSATEIAKHLNRSSGAVGNALERLVELGQASRTNDRPRRFAILNGKRNGNGKAAGTASGRARAQASPTPAEPTTTARATRRRTTTTAAEPATTAPAARASKRLRKPTSQAADTKGNGRADTSQDAAVRAAAAAAEDWDAFRAEHADLLDENSPIYDQRLGALWAKGFQQTMHNDAMGSARTLAQARKRAATVRSAAAKAAGKAEGKAATKAASGDGPRPRRTRKTAAAANGEDAATA